ncbi:AraC family transcriptional regulator [Lysobacter panacisoli]|uniref:AraC family transcriptional regulator n=1 Tax=Lysobacter panacisoli TaxID=1255263 RepID=A0ABP9L557_9GAMM|nr:helix-turn-helix domain-containing protein [Lysobacter panacisoli]
MHPASGYQTRHDACDVLDTHRHDAAYAALVLDGSHVEASADGPIACTPGTLVLHPRWHAHGNRFGRQGAKVVNVELDTAPARLHVLRVPDLREAAEVFVRAPQRLAELLAACEVASAPSLPAWQVEFLSALEHDELAMTELARRAGVSLAHASRSFLKSHGMPPQLLRRELRCRRALALLGGDASLAQIAADSGFADQSHLSRSLREATGNTPSRLRRQIKCVQDANPRAAVQ